MTARVNGSETTAPPPPSLLSRPAASSPADESDQWYVLAELPEHTVTGWDDRWEYVNAHFTHAAAEAFIKRKKHDYRDGMRVYVESQYYAWEFEAIKAAILDGTLTYTPKVVAKSNALVSMVSTE
jgi:hypothetical protein